MLLRDSLSSTGPELPAGTGFFVYTSLFHRDPDSVAHPHEFALQGCAGENLVLLVTSSLLGSLLRRKCLQLPDARGVGPDRALPSTLNNFELDFRMAPAPTAVNAAGPSGHPFHVVVARRGALPAVCWQYSWRCWTWSRLPDRSWRA